MNQAAQNQDIDIHILLSKTISLIWSKINTVVMCSLTSNLKRGLSPGNVVLNKSEAGLPKKSVVNITQIYTVDKNDLCEKIGKVTNERIKEILRGIQLLTEPREL